MKQLLGTITNAATGDVITNAIIAAGTDDTKFTTTDDNGGYILQVPENETFVRIYAIGTGRDGYSEFYIPTPEPAIWNIELQNNVLPELVIRPKDEPGKTVKKMWPVYAGLGLLALLLLTRKKKKR
jgi:hypothetical protein